MISSNNKKQLQEQVARLTNEIEELRLEREESKKNVLHFMQEADTARQELKKAYKIMEGLNLQQGYLSPPPESEDMDAPPPSSSSSLLLKLVSKLSLLDQDKLLALLELVDETDNIPSFSQLKSAQVSLQEELEQLQDEYHATRGALQIENERADIIEKRWKESESALEQAESTIQSLTTELGHLRQQQQECRDNNNKAIESTDIKLSQDLCTSRQDLAITVKHYHDCKVKLEETELSLKHWQTKYDEMNAKHVSGVWGFHRIVSWYRHWPFATDGPRVKAIRWAQSSKDPWKPPQNHQQDTAGRGAKDQQGARGSRQYRIPSQCDYQVFGKKKYKGKHFVPIFMQYTR